MRIFLLVVFICVGSPLLAQWSGGTGSTDFASPISRTGSVSMGPVTSSGVIQSSNAGLNVGSATTSIASDGFSLYLKAAGHTYLNTNASSYITNSGGGYFGGNVGIGTINPAATSRLHLFHPSSSTWLNIEKPNSTTEGGVIFSNNASVMFYLWSDNDDNDALKIEATGLAGENDGAPRMEFPKTNKNIYMAESGGNVGIGTTNPGSFKLAVEGKIGCREVNVTLTSPWPDYVFSPQYKLPSLLEVEKFIKANKHLPEVPSAEEVKENGLSVGEMNAILLKKVEELTLHLIEVNKKVDDQAKEIQSLKGNK